MYFLLAVVFACTDKISDAVGDDSAVACNTANEACISGSCWGDGSEMLPGADCLGCHTGTEGPPRFGVGGTAFLNTAGSAPLEGAIIRVTDAEGQVETLTSNAVGNFYSRTVLIPPFTAEIEVGGVVKGMAGAVGTAGCNSCHSCEGSAGGKLTGP